MSESDCQTSQCHFTSRTIVHRIVVSLGSLFCGLLLLPTTATADEKLWGLLQAGGQVVLIRHSLTTPGVGDPPAMNLDDCSTQRNLVDQGRRHAREVGAAFKARNVPVDSVLSSPWCRCIETARLAFGRAEVSESLSNLFGRPENQAAQLRAMRRLIGEFRGSGNLILVSHGSTIAALTGIAPGTSELVVVTPRVGGELTVAGRLVAHSN
jgi:broad specificity phosphatase PhoE